LILANNLLFNNFQNTNNNLLLIDHKLAKSPKSLSSFHSSGLSSSTLLSSLTSSIGLFVVVVGASSHISSSLLLF